ncbi:MAG: 6-phosphofructokinase [Clostridia bacterium]
MKLVGKALVAQGGGPTAVINQSVVGVVLEAKRHAEITHIYGAINGVEGILRENMIDLSQETTTNLEAVALTPSSGLLSTRIKPDDAFCEKAMEVFKAHDICFFFYVGGNDSSDTVRIMNDYAKKIDYDFCAVHIPKTVDNDLMLNDHTPGYGSAARYVAEAIAGANLDNRALPGVYIAIIMGRHAGFLTAAAALAKRFLDDGPHLIYLPERAFHIDGFLADVKACYEHYGRCVIAVSEGIADENHVAIATKLVENVERDAHGNVQLSGMPLGNMLADLIKDKLKISRVRADTLGYIQRSYPGSISEVDQREAREVGERAVQFAINGQDGSVTIKRVGDYVVDYVLEPLELIAAKTRLMPDEYINEKGNGVTEEFLKYARPLIGSSALESARFRAPKVRKIIK